MEISEKFLFYIFQLNDMIILQACAGIIVALFVGILALFCLNILNEKILSADRVNKYPSSQYRYGSRI